jgi:hypothetical protein
LNSLIYILSLKPQSFKELRIQNVKIYHQLYLIYRPLFYFDLLNRMTDIAKLIIIASTDSYMIRDYTIEYVSELIETSYGLKGIMKELGSYTDKNFLLIVGEGSNTKFIVKISSTLECPQAILLQNYVLRQLETHT